MLKIVQNNKRNSLGATLVLTGFMIITSVLWGNRTFSVKTPPQIIFHMKVPMDGTDDGIYWDLVFWALLPSLILTMGVCAIIFNVRKLFKNNPKLSARIEKLITKYFLDVAIAFLGASLLFVLANYNIFGYLGNIVQNTDLYEKYYVNPNETKITFNKKKRNLIHIYLESIENTYLSKDIGGGDDDNYIPELGKLANDNINFSNTDKIGGLLTVEGTQWTIASMVAQSAGVPLLLPFNADNFDKNSIFMPGVKAMGEILGKNGYNQEIILGSDANFALTSNFYKQHGNYKISDYHTAKEEGRIPEDYFVFWGYEDKKLFQFAKEDILKLAAQDKPFNIVMATIDSHTPDGYNDECLDKKFDSQYKNVLAFQSKQVNDFIDWVKQQDFYEDTTIVITGDHNSMASKFFNKIDSSYVRTPYNVFINSVIDQANNKNRQFSTMDLYPTILASLGATIEGDRLGLGTNLFSNRKTIMEEIGVNNLDKEIQKYSSFYNKKLFGLKK